MGPSAAQKKAIADLEAGGSSVYDVPPPSAGLAGRMQDIALVEVPLSELKTPRRIPDLVAGPGTTTTVHTRTASCKVTVLDRTKWPVKGVTVEVWSQILGYSNGDGLYDSPLFFAGDYALKLRALFIGPASGGPTDAVIPFEVSEDTQFLDGTVTISMQVGLSASGLSTFDRASQILFRAIPKLPGEAGRQLKEMISPFSIGIMVTLAGLWVAAHFVGVGEAADIVVGLSVAIKLGLTLVMAEALVVDMLLFLKAILIAKNEFELEDAAAALARIVFTIGFIAFVKVAEGAVKKGVRNSYRPKGIPDEVTKEPPRSPNVTEALQSKVGKRLGGGMGDAVFEERLKGAEACAKADPTLRSIPPEDAASLRGYTSHKVTKIGASSNEADYLVLNRFLRFGNKAGVAGVVEYLDSMLRGYNRFPKLRAKTFRGLRFDTIPDWVNKMKVGRPFRDKAFFSTSIEEDAALKYMNGDPTKPAKVLFHVKGYSSRYIQSLTEVVTDKEALYRPGTIFIVVKKLTAADGVVHISLVEVEESVKDFASVWGTSAALVANLKALEVWAEKQTKKPAAVESAHAH